MHPQTQIVRILTFVAIAFAQAAWADRPNLVLILADDLALGDLAGGGGKQTRTPHLDRLGRQSVRFLQAYSASCVCAAVGDLLAELERLGLTNKTIVIFASDNGPDPLTDSTLSPLLFDLQHDPKESVNIAAKHPDLVRRMNQRLREWTVDIEKDRLRPSPDQLEQ